MISKYTLIHVLKNSDKYNKTMLDMLDEHPVSCYSMANNFIGLAVKEKGIRYFFPKGCTIAVMAGELVCIVHENKVEDK